MNFIIDALKIIFLLGILVTIHEGGHFFIAKLCKVRVNQFSIGFGKIIFEKQMKETKYKIRMIPLGGFVSMEGETEESSEKDSFSKANIWKKIAIVSAGAIVNIIFGILIYFLVVSFMGIQFSNPEKDTFINRIYYGGIQTKEFIFSLGISIKQLFTGNVSPDQMTGIVGISNIVSKTKGIIEYLYIMSVISVSLGVTNVLPIPALDGGKLLILLIELIRRKPMKIETEAKIQLIGFSVLIALSIYVTYNDIVRVIKM